jgi:osmotically-inducible protein OsmY
MNKLFLMKIVLIWIFTVTSGNSQYTITEYSNQYFLENIIHTVLVNNNYRMIEVIQDDVGEIKLKGRVGTYYDKLWLTETVTGIPGVRKVSNQVVVDNIPVTDDVLETNIHEGIIYVSSGNRTDDIKVEVNKGIVFLSGNVINADIKNSAHKVASLHEGVRGIVNKIKVQPLSETLFDNNLENFLIGIIKERYPKEKEIKVSVENGNVILQGKVSSEEIKENIVGNISDMEGVEKINNNLTIEVQEKEQTINQEKEE